MHRGYIKFWRKILESEMFKNLTSKQRDVMAVCILLANHTEKEWEWGGRIYKCQPGEFITSLDSLHKHCAKDISVKNVRTALKKLEKWGFLANQSAKTGRLITLINWGTYQGIDEVTGKQTGKQAANRRQTGGKQAATNKNDKNDKNGNKREGEDHPSPPLSPSQTKLFQVGGFNGSKKSTGYSQVSTHFKKGDPKYD